ncbi:MAG: AEC family transporter [Myxococcales bacterium]|nr:AEC family transporter [Myxococcales bacterium]MDH5306641.1 AEC family transporter [Myxococcales bacterium]MDH5565075.1 AEC family transporter [Myxococcales bacterium]
MIAVLTTVVPVFSVVALGYALGGPRGLQRRTLSNLALFVASPALLFSVLSGVRLDPMRWGVLAGGTFFMAAGTALLAALYMRASGVGRGVLLPAVFFNGGNMGLACARLAYGPAGLEAGALIFVSIAVLSAVFGIWIAKGENGLREALRLPLVYGAAGGIAVSLTGIALPRIVAEPIDMLGAMAIPLMLLTLGVQLRALAVRDVRDSLVAVAVRMGGGFACALLFLSLLDASEIDRKVLLLYSIMPPAVMNAVIAERYQTDPALVASAITLGTLLSVAAIPAVLLFSR